MNHNFSTVPTASYCQLKEEHTIPNSAVCVFMTGFCLGMVFFYLSDKNFARESGLMDPVYIDQLQEFSAYQEGLLQYVALQRMKQFFTVMICALCRFRLVLMQGILGICGFELGILLFTAVYRYGASGLLFSFLLFIPHGILYLLIILRIMYIIKESDTKYFHKNSQIKLWGNIVLLIGLFMLGILCETYINPHLMQGSVRILFR